MMPPLMIVGSRPAASSNAPTIEVVVVLPCVPAMAIDHLRRINSPSISARRTTGNSRWRAAWTSGLSALTPAEILGLVSDRDLDAERLQAADIGAIGHVAALNLVAEIFKNLGNAAHAD